MEYCGGSNTLHKKQKVALWQWRKSIASQLLHQDLIWKPGSSPVNIGCVRPIDLHPYSLMDRAVGFYPIDQGSTPCGDISIGVKGGSRGKEKQSTGMRYPKNPCRVYAFT